MARFDNLVNKIIAENMLSEDLSNLGIGGMMNMSSDDLKPAKGWKYVDAPDEDEETVDEGSIGTIAGSAGGAMLGGPVGAALGGAVGKELIDDEEGEPKGKRKHRAHDKTGHMSDRELVDYVKKNRGGSVAGYTVAQAEKELDDHGSLSAKMRDAFARDAYEHLSKEGKKLAKEAKSTGRPISKKNPQTKAAAAGKDIGKKGKNFEKIAKSAGKKYGSKAAGDRVAGAILAKMRGK